MALERKDRIRDTSTTTGTGTLSLAASAPTGFRTFVAGVTSLATVRYLIESSDYSEWEVGEGVFTDGSPDTLTRVTVFSSSNAGALVNFSAGTKTVSCIFAAQDLDEIVQTTEAPNLLKNGNFINNSTNGYGGTPDDWVSSNANPVQGGIPALTKQNVIDILGVATGDIEGLWNLKEASGNASDLSDSNYTLTDNNTVLSSSDGQMVLARDFELSNSESLSIADASCPNLEITGSKTFVCYIKFESLPGTTQIFMAKHSGGAATQLYLQDSGVFRWLSEGLTTNEFVTADTKPEVGKWYMLVGIYDSANSKLKIWVNGVKKEVTASGSSTDTNGIFYLGRNNSGTYFDGLMQNAMVLSVALSDDQVKRLFAATMYRGQKIRRSTTDAYLYQDLPMSEVQRLRGKRIALRADIYQEVASTAQISLLITNAAGATSEAIVSATDATIDTWLEKYATGVISASAVGIRVKIKHSTTDGNSWFKNVALYEGAMLIPFDHSKDDWYRFPRLLRMEIPSMAGAYPYQYEENRAFTFDSKGTVDNATGVGRFTRNGKWVHGWLKLTLTGVPGFSTSKMPILPIISSANERSGDQTSIGVGGYQDSGTANKIDSLASNLGAGSTAYLWIFNGNGGAIISNTSPITWANGDTVVMAFSYEID